MPKVGVNQEPLLERLIFAFDGADYRVVKCDSDGQLLAALASDQNVQSKNYGWISANWQKNPLSLGYSASIAELVFNLNPIAGTVVLVGTAVPSGEIWVIQCVHAINATRQASVIYLAGTIAGVGVYLNAGQPSTATYMIFWTGQITLKQGDKLSATFTGTTAGDDLYLGYGGYKVNIAQ